MILVMLLLAPNMVLSAITSEDWSAGSPFTYYTPEDYRDIFTSAYLNVSFENDSGTFWDKTETGRFGGGPLMPTSGKIIHVTNRNNAKDHTGCTLPYLSPYGEQLDQSNEPWIALVKRGLCSFEAKVENAFKSRASGIIIYNDRDSASLDRMMLSTDTKRNISAVFIYRWKGEELARLTEKHPNVHIQITVASQTVSRAASINRTSVLFVSITFIVLIVISLAWLIFYYVQRFRYSNARDRLSKRLNNAAKKAVSKIPTKTIKGVDKSEKELPEDVECCAICIEPYKNGDALRILPCGHDYHKTCIDPWLLEHRTCPMCKMDILKHYGFVCTDSQESILQVERDNSGQVVLSLRNVNGIPLSISRGSDSLEINNELEETSDNSRSPSPNELTPSIPRIEVSGKKHGTQCHDRQCHSYTTAAEINHCRNNFTEIQSTSSTM